jgi:hypothetical protein
MIVKMLLVAEIEIGEYCERIEDTAHETGTLPPGAEDFAQSKLDAFREAVLPTENYGVSLYRVPKDFQRQDYL